METPIKPIDIRSGRFRTLKSPLIDVINQLIRMNFVMDETGLGRATIHSNDIYAGLWHSMYKRDEEIRKEYPLTDDIVSVYREYGWDVEILIEKKPDGGQLFVFRPNKNRMI